MQCCYFSPASGELALEHLNDWIQGSLLQPTPPRDKRPPHNLLSAFSGKEITEKGREMTAFLPASLLIISLRGGSQAKKNSANHSTLVKVLGCVRITPD